MSETKDYLKVIVIALITALASQLVGKALVKSDKINNSVTQSELTKTKDDIKQDINIAKKESMIYTDDKLLSHEKVHNEINTQYEQIQSDLTIIKNYLINNK